MASAEALAELITVSLAGSRVFVDELIVVQLAKVLVPFYGTRGL